MEKISKIHETTGIKKESNEPRNRDKKYSFKETLKLKMQEYEELREHEKKQQSVSNIETEKISVKNIIPAIKRTDINELKPKKKQADKEKY